MRKTSVFKCVSQKTYKIEKHIKTDMLVFVHRKTAVTTILSPQFFYAGKKERLMNTKTKKRVLNAVMIAAIVLILAAAVLITGTLRGWFARPADAVTNADVLTVSVENKSGSVNIERAGLSYSLNEGNILKDGDKLETLNGSTIDIVAGKNRYTLNENSCANVIIDEDNVKIELTSGGIFANMDEPGVISVMGKDISAQSGVFSVSAPYGSAAVYVLENEVELDAKTYKAGQAADILSSGIEDRQLSIGALNEFELFQVEKISAEKTLCFGAEDVRKLEADREKQRRDALDAKLLEEDEETSIDEQRRENEQNANESVTKQPAPDGKKDDNSPNSGDKTPSKNDSDKKDDEQVYYCTLTIRCDTILNNMGELTEGKNAYVPKNGCILAKSKLKFKEGETVFDVLKRACSIAGIQLEYSWTPMYGSYYIEGINNLYEFDCGNESGWMYRVNGWFPNYGCSSYTLKDGDAISFDFTCKGYGDDIH